MRALWHDLGRLPRLLARRNRLPALRELFCSTNAVLRDLGVDYWLAYGTLLGYHREGAILAHDRDVDFGLPEEAYPIVRQARFPPSFRLYDTSFKHDGPKLYVEHRGWEADLYFYRTFASVLKSGERSRNQGDRAPLPRKAIFPLQEVTFLGQSTRIPADPEQVLRIAYGYLGPDAVRDRATGYFVRVRP